MSAFNLSVYYHGLIFNPMTFDISFSIVVALSLAPPQRCASLLLFSNDGISLRLFPLSLYPNLLYPTQLAVGSFQRLKQWTKLAKAFSLSFQNTCTATAPYNFEPIPQKMNNFMHPHGKGCTVFPLHLNPFRYFLPWKSINSTNTWCHKKTKLYLYTKSSLYVCLFYSLKSCFKICYSWF